MTLGSSAWCCVMEVLKYAEASVPPEQGLGPPGFLGAKWTCNVSAGIQARSLKRSKPEALGLECPGSGNSPGCWSHLQVSECPGPELRMRVEATRGTLLAHQSHRHMAFIYEATNWLLCKLQ